jgi:ABC-2 type transport system permease protein
LGAGLPLSFFLLKLLSDINLSMTELRYFSLNTLYVTESLAKAEGYGLSVAVLIAVGIVLYGASFAVFKKKDLPL